MKLIPIHRKPYDPSTDIVGYKHYCEGCGHTHEIPVVADSGLTGQLSVWIYDHNPTHPTIQPSINLKSGIYAGQEECQENTPECIEWNEHIIKMSKICHYHIISGKISYCGDTTHSLSGQVRPLLDNSEWPYKPRPTNTDGNYANN